MAKTPTFTRLKNPSSWRRISIALWKESNDPTVYGHEYGDATNSLTYLEKINQSSPTKVTMTHLVIKTIAMTLKKFPDLNGMIKWRRVYLRNSVDIFAQVAITEKSDDESPDLSGAKIESCDQKSINEIAEALRTKSEMIRMDKDPQFKSVKRLLGSLPPSFLSLLMKTITFLTYNLGINLSRFNLPPDPFGSAMVTSVGMLDVPSGFAPLVPMSHCPIIVCVGKIKDRPMVIEGQVVARPAYDLAFTFDHRFIDGLTASRMAHYFFGILENPENYLN